MKTLIEKIQGGIGFDLPQFTDEDDLASFIVEVFNIKAPRWAVEDYEAAPEEFFDWLYTTAKATIFRGALKQVVDSPAATAKINAQIHYWCMERTKSAESVTERSMMYQFHKADTEQWFRHLDGEFDTIDELVANMLDGLDDNATKYSNFSYISKTVMPLLKEAGAKGSDVWGIPNSVSKAAEAVPAIRYVLAKEPEDGPVSQKAKEQVLAIVRKISDPKFTVRPFREEMRKIRGEGSIALTPIPIESFFMPGGWQWYIIKAPDKRYANTVETGLGGMIKEVNMTDGWAFAQEISAMLKKGNIRPQYSEPVLDQELLQLIPQ